MSVKFKPGRGFWIFIFRNLLLYFLLFNAYLHLKKDLDLVFLSIVFLIAVLSALWMEAARLRFWGALLLALAFPVLLRVLFFLVFRLQISVSPGPDTDFLYFFFDRNFIPALLPFYIVWLFNFWALRYPIFPYLEAGFNAFLILFIFWSEANYKITLYPHPSLFASALFVFLLFEVFVLILARKEAPLKRTVNAPGPETAEDLNWKRELRSFLSFAWIVIPLLLILLFFLLSRFNEGAVRQGGGLMKPTLFRFDFSQFIKLENEIEMSDDLILLLRKEGQAERILLRRFILSGYDKRKGFYHINKKRIEELPVTVSDLTEEILDPEYAARTDVRQEYFFVNFDPTSLIGMNYPVKVTPLKNWDSSSFLRIYRVLSRVSAATSFELDNFTDRSLTPEQYRHYTLYDNNEGIKELAETITLGEDNTLAKVLLIRDYLKENYFYSLRPGLAVDGDQLSHFLNESKKGYCSYFAFAMALMCRSLGIPARVAVGFYVDPESEVLNFYEVRAYQAHAWVEVYFGDYGWIEFDPSSENLAPGEEFSLQFGFDFQHLAGLIEEILRNQDQLEEEFPERLGVRKQVFRWGSDLVKGLVMLARIWYIVLPVLYLLGLGTIKLSPYISFKFSKSVRKKIRHLFLFGLIKLYGLGLIRRPAESILEYSRRMDREQSLHMTGWSEYYLQAVFAEHFPVGDFDPALKAYFEFLSSFRETRPWYLRFFGFLNPLHSLRRKL